jgi:Rrf2 family iron-sulfur cluster assembly transcriptional regulator
LYSHVVAFYKEKLRADYKDFIKENKLSMKLSTRGRYAVMAIVDLATNSRGNPVSLSEIAERQEISLSYLEQLFSKLRQGSIVKSVRGSLGGYTLAHPPHEISVADIVTAVNEPLKAIRCTQGSIKGCLSTGQRCLVHDLWEDLGNHIYLYLKSVKLSDICEKRVKGTSNLLFSSPQHLAQIEK